MFVIFRVKGPFGVSFHSARNGAKLITRTAKSAFWADKARRYKGQVGCYIFAINNGRHYSPGYIGVATSSFGGEVFTDSKLNRYNEALADYKNGKPVLFFVVAPVGRGKPAKSKIVALEKHLIQTVKAAYPRLRNKVGTRIPRWGIAGVLRGGKGKTSKGARALRQIMGID
jgi:hypothetical protein